MTELRPIRALFQSDVTRPIPPVVYFQDQAPQRLADEVSEYIVTGGFEDGHPGKRRVPDGIHEQYVRLLTAIVREHDQPGGPTLPTSWISGFYGSGKSSFAKLLGLALDGVALPDGTSLAKAWLDRNQTARRGELLAVWDALHQRMQPIAVVFDIGGVARDGEHVHHVVLREVQRRLGYCTSDPHVAGFELNLERAGDWERFQALSHQVLGQPWAEVCNQPFSEEQFSQVMHAMHPDRYIDPMSWFESRAGEQPIGASPRDVCLAIADMLRYRAPGRTLFLVVDEVSQFVVNKTDRTDKLRAFAQELGGTLRGSVWLLALGQQKIDEEANEDFLVWAKDRFPPQLRVHLSVTNIRDVVHKRLLAKKPEADTALRALFERYRPDLKLFGYRASDITADEFVECYPLLPEQIGLVLELTTAMRSRSERVQGDDQAIRGLLQLLGELFREKGVAEAPLGDLITLDQIYDVQQSALDSATQDSMRRITDRTLPDALLRVAKAVAMLELIQDHEPTTPALVAQCLYDRLDRGNHTAEIHEALEELRGQNLLGYSEQSGYKLQSSAAEEWERERREIGVTSQTVVELVKDALRTLVEMPKRPTLQARPFPLAAVLSDAHRVSDLLVRDPRDPACVRVDFRFVPPEAQGKTSWLKRSDDAGLCDRLIWVIGDKAAAEAACRELARSQRMIARYSAARDSMQPARRALLITEEGRAEALQDELRRVVGACWHGGTFYFRGRSMEPHDFGAAFATALEAATNRVLPELYPQFDDTNVQPSELKHLLGDDLTGLSPKFMPSALGIFVMDNGRPVALCEGAVPSRVLDYIERQGAVAGSELLQHFGGPPFGYAASVVHACLIGLVRGAKIRVQQSGLSDIVAVRDPGSRDVFEKERTFRSALFVPTGDGGVTMRDQAEIASMLERLAGTTIDRDQSVIADFVARTFPDVARRLRAVQALLLRVPGGDALVDALHPFERAIESASRNVRETEPTLKALRSHIDVLRDGLHQLATYEAELTAAAVDATQAAQRVLDEHHAQLVAIAVDATNLHDAAERVRETLDEPAPWRTIASVAEDVEAITAAYRAERSRERQRQAARVEAAREALRGRRGWSTLTDDQRQRILRPLQAVAHDTTPEALQPSLRMMRESFDGRLADAVDAANHAFDDAQTAGDDTLVVRPVDLQLANREVATEAEVDALVTEIRDTLLAQVRGGARVRIVR